MIFEIHKIMNKLCIGKENTAFSLSYKNRSGEIAIKYVDLVALSRFSRGLISDDEKLFMMKEARRIVGINLILPDLESQFD